MTNSNFKRFKNELMHLASTDMTPTEIKCTPLFCMAYLWLSLTDNQVYKLIDILKGTKLVTDINCDGEDNRYYICDIYVLVDNRQRKQLERG